MNDSWNGDADASYGQLSTVLLYHDDYFLEWRRRGGVEEAIEVHKALKANVSPNAVVLGPTAKSIARMNNRYYFQIIVKYKNEPQLQEFLEQLMMETQEVGSKKLLMTIDMEPQHFL